MNIRAALYATLAAASPVVSALAAYRGAPAIFTARPVPQDAARPYAVISGVGETDDGNVTTDRVATTFDVAVYADATGSALALDAAVAAVRAALHRKRLAIPGGHHIATRAVGRSEAPADATIAGRILTFEIRAQ